MKPAPFSYLAPSSLPEVVTLLAEHGSSAKLLAGGQSLIPAMNFRVTSPTLLIDLNRIRELDYVRPDVDGALHIGSMTRQRTIERSPLIRERAPLLAEAMPHVAHPQIRNRGTVGGSLVHADPAAEIPVIMQALDAKFVLTSGRGERTIAAPDFYLGMFMVEAAEDEILTEIIIPAKPISSGWAFMEAARRQGDYAMMGVAAGITLDGDRRCLSARLVYLNAGDKPVNARKAVDVLAGKSQDSEAIMEAARVASEEEIEPMGNLHASPEYQRHLAKVLTRRALDLAFQRAATQSA